MWSTFLNPEFFNAILRATTPILFATLASGVAAKAGICNMALEGILLFTALFGVIFSNLTGSWILALVFTMIAGGIIGLILAFFILNLKTDEILAAIAINLTATGGTVLLLLAFSGDRGASTFASVAAPTISIPLIAGIPFIGKILSGRNILTYFAFISVIIMHLVLYKTPLGLRIRAVGENKNAAESVGISARKIQYIALVISGVLCAVGGYFLSGGYMNSFTKDMSAGRGFIALAAGSMGGDAPVGGMLVALLFGAAQAVGNQLQLTNIPVELIQMLPYATTLIGLAVSSYIRLKRKEALAAK